MHELDIVIHIVKTVEDFAVQNGLTKIDTLVLEIGELSGVVPQYIEACYPAVIEGSLLQETRLKIEMLPGLALCNQCGQVFHPVRHNYKCPECGDRDWDALSGKEFMIKEVIAC